MSEKDANRALIETATLRALTSEYARPRGKSWAPTGTMRIVDMPRGIFYVMADALPMTRAELAYRSLEAQYQRRNST